MNEPTARAYVTSSPQPICDIIDKMWLAHERGQRIHVTLESNTVSEVLLVETLAKTPEEKIAALEARVAELEANQSVVTWAFTPQPEAPNCWHANTTTDARGNNFVG